VRHYRRNLKIIKRAPAGLWFPLPLQIAGVLAVLGGLGIAVWQGLGHPDLKMRDPTGLSPSDKIETAKLILALVASLGGAVALTVAYRRQRIGESTEHRDDLRLFFDRLGKSAEQLGHDSPAVCLAGVYALADLADQSGATQRQLCIDVLCGYLRVPWKRQIDNAEEDIEVGQKRQISMTIIATISERLRTDSRTSWSGCTFNFTGAVLDGGDFSRAHFDEGWTSFADVEFIGGHTSFDGAFFSADTVTFAGAQFCGGVVSFRRAQFVGEVHFNRTRFTGSVITFQGAVFSEWGFLDYKWRGGINFNEAIFSAGFVTFLEVNFGGGHLHFKWTRFSGGEVSFAFADDFIERSRLTASFPLMSFIRVELSGGIVDFSEASVERAIDFANARFQGSIVDLSRLRARKIPIDFRPSFANGAELPEGLRMPARDLPKIDRNELLLFSRSRVEDLISNRYDGTFPKIIDPAITLAEFISASVNDAEQH
jgi:uncharacterized protein YjbI with pentapeptide repeats